MTGSGKTLGVLVPGIIHALTKGLSLGRSSPFVVVLAPTRELAQQIDDVNILLIDHYI